MTDEETPVTDGEDAAIDGENISETRSSRRWWWIGGAAALAIVVIIAVGVANGWGSGSPAAEDADPTPSASASASPAPSASGSPAPSESPSTAPEEEGDDVPPAAEPRPTAPPVGLDQPAQPAEGVRVSLASIVPISGQASVPGEVDGPALQISVDVENLSDDEALTDTMIVNVYYGPERTPANILVSPRTDLPVSIAPGETAKGLYAFTVPEAARGQVLVEVDLSLDLPVVLFEGAVS